MDWGLAQASDWDKECLTGLGHLVPDIASSTLPDSVRSLFLSSFLVAVEKESGGKRPIAMGETFYKLACLYTISLVRTEVSSTLAPIQLALSPGGSEAAYHFLQSAVDLHPEWAVVSADITNAFNTRKRSRFLRLFTKR